jgi:hypothetical protein
VLRACPLYVDRHAHQMRQLARGQRRADRAGDGDKHADIILGSGRGASEIADCRLQIADSVYNLKSNLNSEI